MNKALVKLTTSLLITSLLLTGCGGENVPAEQPELLTPINVVDKTEKVTYRDIYDLIAYQASVIPYTEEISFEQDGVFDKYYVEVGEHVKKGQKLASQSNEAYEMELEELQNSYDLIQKSYNDAKRVNSVDMKIIAAKLAKLKSQLKEVQEGKKEIQYEIDKLELSKKDLEESSLLQYKDYQAQLNMQKSRMDIIKEKVLANTIVAPVDGVIAQKAEIEPGEVISANYPVMLLYDTSKFGLTCDPTAIYTFNQTDIYYASINGKNYDIEVNGDKDAQLAGSGYRDIVEGRKFAIKDSTGLNFGDIGLFCFKFHNRENVLSITTKALYSEGIGEHYVFQIKDGKREKVYVEVGTITQVYAEIVSGLEEGDVIMDE